MTGQVGVDAVLMQSQQLINDLQRMQDQKRREEDQKRLEEQMAEQRRLAEERRKQDEERRKQDEERRRKEAEEAAQIWQEDFRQLLDTADEKRKAAEAKVPAVLEVNGASDEQIIGAASDFEAALLDLRHAMKACTTFMVGKHRQLQGITEHSRCSANALLQRMGKADRNVEPLVARVRKRKQEAQDSRDKEARRIAAIKEAKRQEELFKKYDRDGDGRLRAQDIVELVKEEHGFELTPERLEGIRKSEAYDSDSGVPWSKFAQLKLLIGIAREEFRAKQRKEELERKKVLADMQTARVRENTAGVTEALAGIEGEVSKAEELAKPLSIMRGGRSQLPPDQLESRAAAVETAVDAAKDFLAAAREQSQRLGGEENNALEPDPGRLAVAESKKLQLRLDWLEVRLGKAGAASKAVRDRILLQQRKALLLQEVQAAERAAA